MSIAPTPPVGQKLDWYQPPGEILIQYHPAARPNPSSVSDTTAMFHALAS